MIDYPSILDAIRASANSMLRLFFQRLTLTELVEAGTFIGPERLQPLIAVGGCQPPITPPATLDTMIVEPKPTPVVEQLEVETAMAAILDIAFRTRVGAPAMPTQAAAIRAALLLVAARRKTAPLLTMNDDVTRTVPQPTSVPPPLSDADYAAAAQRHGVEVAAIKAVAIVESGGKSGFDTMGRPKILFEAHHFNELTNGKFVATHPHLATSTWAAARAFYSWDQYERLYEAMVLDIDAALKAASWGKFQVLGQYHDGWPDVRSFVAAMYESEVNHLRSFEAHCAGSLMAALKRKDWLGFAAYNGKDQARYGPLIKNAYNSLVGR